MRNSTRGSIPLSTAASRRSKNHHSFSLLAHVLFVLGQKRKKAGTTVEWRGEDEYGGVRRAEESIVERGVEVKGKVAVKEGQGS